MEPVVFCADDPQLRFEAFIDVEDERDECDKLSQINTLQQVENLASYPLVRQGLIDGHIVLVLLWFVDKKFA